MIRALTLAASGATATLLLLRVAVGGPLGDFAGPGPTTATFNSAIAATASAMARRRGLAADNLRIKILSPDAFHAGESRARETAPPRDAEASAHAALLEAVGLARGLDAALEDETDRGANLAPDVAWSSRFDLSARALLISNEALPPTPTESVVGFYHDVALLLLDKRFPLRPFLDGVSPSPVSARAAVPARAATKGGTRPATKSASVTSVRVMPASPRNSDALLARQSLIEGDALVQALEHDLPTGLPSYRGLRIAAAQAQRAMHDSGASEADDSTHKTIGTWDQERQWFSQTAGLTFVASQRALQPWSTIDGTWLSPPQSTEHILHPEKFARHEAPDDLTARLALEQHAPWQVADEDTFGEFGTFLFLQAGVDAYHAERASTGWAGDRAYWLRSDSDGFALWITTWDDETDARDFADQALIVLERMSDSVARRRSDSADGGRLTEAIQLTDSRGRRFALEAGARTVGMMFAAPEAGLVALHRLVEAAAAPFASVAPEKVLPRSRLHR